MVNSAAAATASAAAATASAVATASTAASSVAAALLVSPLAAGTRSKSAAAEAGGLARPRSPAAAATAPSFKVLRYVGVSRPEREEVSSRRTHSADRQQLADAAANGVQARVRELALTLEGCNAFGGLGLGLDAINLVSDVDPDSVHALATTLSLALVPV